MSPKRCFSFDLGGQVLGSPVVEGLDGDRTAIGGAEQPIDDLHLAFLAVAVVTERSQIAAAPLHIVSTTRRRAPGIRLREMLAGQPLLHLGLAGEQPIESLIQLRRGDPAEPQNLCRAGASGVGVVEHPRGGELRGRGDDPADDHRLHELAGPVAFRAEDAVEAGRPDQWRVGTPVTEQIVLHRQRSWRKSMSRRWSMSCLFCS